MKRVKVYLSAMEAAREEWPTRFALQSFYWHIKKRNYENFMIDSGGYSFLSGTKNIDIEKYTKNYVAFLKTHKTRLFFNLDFIPPFFSWKHVRDETRRLEDKVGKGAMWVWYAEYGKENLEDFRKNSGRYVALSCANYKNKLSSLPYFRFFKDRDIHVLGSIQSELISLPGVISCDTSSWVTNARGGHLAIDFCPPDKVICKKYDVKNYQEARKISFDVFREVQKYYYEIGVEEENYYQGDLFLC